MASEVTFDISHPMAILDGMLAKTEVIATIAYADTAPVVLELEHARIPYDEWEASYYEGLSVQGFTPEMIHRAGLHYDEAAEAVGKEFHMEDTLFFTQNPANPLEALTGTATGLEYPSHWHYNMPDSGHFSKEGATMFYITGPAKIGFATFIESIRVNTDKLVQP